MYQISVVSLLLCCCVLTFAFDFEDCGSQMGKFNDIKLSSCDGSEIKCEFVRGTEISVSLKFTPSEDISELQARVSGVLLEIPVSMPMEKPDPCKDPDSGIKCPLKKDVEVEYKAALFLEKKIPALSIDVMLEFIAKNGEKIICIKFPAKIK